MEMKTRRAGASAKVRWLVALGYTLLACAALVANARATAPADAGPATPVTPPAR